MFDKKAYAAEYRRTHKQEIDKYNAEYRKTHREERAACAKEYYKLHKEEIDKRAAKYHREHREEALERAAEYRRTHRAEEAEYYKLHKTEKLEYASRYSREHQIERAAARAKRRALKAGALIGAAPEQVEEIKEIYRKSREGCRVRCYLCGKLIPIGHRHVDHIIPLSKGGMHTPSNLAIACDTCNLYKSAKLPEEIGLLI